jgi:hypothetical protein
VDYCVSGLRALINGIIFTIVACIMTVAFASSGWWMIVTLFLVPALVFGPWALISAFSGRRQSCTPKVIISIFMPPMIFVISGLYSWAVGIPYGFEMWLRSDMLLAAVTVPILYILFYGGAFFVPTLLTASGVFYAATQNRLRECWTVCMMNLAFGFLSGGIWHLVHAAHTQL